MSRPVCCRRVSAQPASTFFKPRGIPLSLLETITLAVDEYEALRLADLEGLYQEDAADQMGISRPTFGRIVESARKKIAEALVNGKALEIKGGEIEMVSQREFVCSDCQHKWAIPYGTGRPAPCPQCQSRNIHRAPEDRGGPRRGKPGPGEGRGRRMQHGRCRGAQGPRASRQGGSE
jgi:predicted DNA-binding protein (UPF0251 family)